MSDNDSLDVFTNLNRDCPPTGSNDYYAWYEDEPYKEKLVTVTTESATLPQSPSSDPVYKLMKGGDTTDLPENNEKTLGRIKTYTKYEWDDPDRPKEPDVFILQLFEIEIFKEFQDELADPTSNIYGETYEEVLEIFIAQYSQIAFQYNMIVAEFNMNFKRNMKTGNAGTARKKRGAVNLDDLQYLIDNDLLVNTNTIAEIQIKMAENTGEKKKELESKMVGGIANSIKNSEQSLIPKDAPLPEISSEVVVPGFTDVVPEVENKCPTEECWFFKPETSSCELKPGCTDVVCNADSIVAKFSENLFGPDNTDSLSIEPYTLKDEDLTYGIECKLGDCGMSSEIVDENLILDIPLSISKKLNLGKNSITIMTHAWVGAVTFSCKYPAFVEVSSDTFRPVVQTHKSVVSGTGQLDAGFELILNRGKEEVISIGSTLNVKAKWNVDIKGLDFYLTNCNVVQHDFSVAVVKDGCFASALGSNRIAPNEFEFKTFNVRDSSQNMQEIQCKIKICEGFGCGDTQSKDVTCDSTSAYGWN